MKMSEPIFVTMYPHYWGRGTTPKESKKQARKVGGSGRNWVTFRLPPRVVESWVDGMGTLLWRYPDEMSEEECAASRARVNRYGVDVVAVGSQADQVLKDRKKATERHDREVTCG